jgi:hypothetical protein
MEVIALSSLSGDLKLALLKELGLDSDGRLVTQGGTPVLDRYTQEPVRLENMMLLPGSTIVLDNNPFSLASYIEEFGDAF